jgi:PPE-repeat protein
MSFLVLSPEINSLRMFTGAGSAPMLEAAAAWDGLASELGSAASSFSSVISGLVGQAWQGPASAAMTAAAAPYGIGRTVGAVEPQWAVASSCKNIAR